MYSIISSKVLCLSIVVLFSLIIITTNCDTSVELLTTINNKLALNLLNNFPSDGNNFFSPLSITTVLLMIMNGANGITNLEFRQLFNLDNSTNTSLINDNVKSVLKTLHLKQSDKLVLKFANRLLVANNFPLNDDYKQAIDQTFESSIESVDFKNNSKQIIQDIKSWVSNKTSGMIKNIFNDDETLPENTPLVMLNAVYFKGMWKYVFDPKETCKENFYNFGDLNKSTLVDMMISQRNMVVKHSRILQANLFELPFSDGSDMSMMIILPDEMDGLNSVTKKLNMVTLRLALKAFRKYKGSSKRLLFPKFKLEQEYDMKEHLQALGLKSLFEDSANLSRMSPNLKVGKAIHKAYIEVNEEGAEAAGVTKAIFSLRSFMPNPTEVDRPFLFVIIDKKSSLIWFLGQIRSLS